MPRRPLSRFGWWGLVFHQLRKLKRIRIFCKLCFYMNLLFLQYFVILLRDQSVLLFVQTPDQIHGRHRYLWLLFRRASLINIIRAFYLEYLLSLNLLLRVEPLILPWSTAWLKGLRTVRAISFLNCPLNELLFHLFLHLLINIQSVNFLSFRKVEGWLINQI